MLLPVSVAPEHVVLDGLRITHVTISWDNILPAGDYSEG